MNIDPEQINVFVVIGFAANILTLLSVAVRFAICGHKDNVKNTSYPDEEEKILTNLCVLPLVFVTSAACFWYFPIAFCYLGLVTLVVEVIWNFVKCVILRVAMSAGAERLDDDD